MMWQDGETAQAISNVIGKSRNAVIGKMNRMGVKRNETSSEIRTDAEATAESSVSKGSEGEQDTIVQEQTEAEDDDSYDGELIDPSKIYEINNEPRLSLMYLTNRTCRWPIGDPSTKNFWFCGKQSVIDKPYCTEHCELAFQNNPRTGMPENSNTR